MHAQDFMELHANKVPLATVLVLLHVASRKRGRERGERVGETVGSLPSKLAAGQLLYYVIITNKSSKQNNIFVLQAKS